MKFGIIFSMATALLLMVSCNNDKRKSFDEAVDYNDFIVDHINSLDSAYILALATDNGIEECLKKCDVLVDLCDKTTADFKGIQPYKGDSTLTMQALAYTQFMKNNGKTEIKKLLKMIDSYENASFEEQEKLAVEVQKTAGEIDKQYEIEINKLELVQQKFSRKFNITILNTSRHEN